MQGPFSQQETHSFPVSKSLEPQKVINSSSSSFSSSKNASLKNPVENLNSPSYSQRIQMQRFEEMSKQEIERAMETQNTLMEQYNFDLKDYFGGPRVEDLDESCHDHRLKKLFNEVLFTEHENVMPHNAKGAKNSSSQAKNHQKMAFSASGNQPWKSKYTFMKDKEEPGLIEPGDNLEIKSFLNKNEESSQSFQCDPLANEEEESFYPNNADLQEEKFEMRISSTSLLSEISRKRENHDTCMHKNHQTQYGMQGISRNSSMGKTNPKFDVPEKNIEISKGGFASSSAASLLAQNGSRNNSKASKLEGKCPLHESMKKYVSEVIRNLSIVEITDMLVDIFQRHPAEFKAFQLKNHPFFEKTQTETALGSNWSFGNICKGSKEGKWAIASEVFTKDANFIFSPKTRPVTRGNCSKTVSDCQNYYNTLNSCTTPKKPQQRSQSPKINHSSCSPGRCSKTSKDSHTQNQMASQAGQVTSSRKGLKPSGKSPGSFDNSYGQKRCFFPSSIPQKQCVLAGKNGKLTRSGLQKGHMASSSLSGEHLVGLKSHKDFQNEKKQRKNSQHVSADRKLIERTRLVKKVPGSSSSFVFNSTGPAGLSPKTPELEEMMFKRGQAVSPKQINRNPFLGQFKSGLIQGEIGLNVLAKTNMKSADLNAQPPQQKAKRSKAQTVAAPVHAFLQATKTRELSKNSKQVLMSFKNRMKGIKSDRKQHETLSNLDENGPRLRIAKASDDPLSS